jgi:TRAP-type uncharacterized transport system fused permease subunit
MMIGTPFGIGLALGSAITGIVLLSAGISGVLIRHCLWWERVLFFIAGALLFIPGVMSDLAGLVLGALIVVSQIVFQRPIPVVHWAKMATSGRIEDD